jgi:hypothetical protein
MRNPLPHGFITVTQMANLLNVSAMTLHKMMTAGDLIPDHRHGQRWLFRPDQVDEAKAMFLRKQGERRIDGSTPYGYVDGDIRDYIRLGDAVLHLRKADPDGIGVSRRTLYRWMNAGKLQGRLYGRGLVYLLRTEVDELCAKLENRTLIANRPKG